MKNRPLHEKVHARSLASERELVWSEGDEDIEEAQETERPARRNAQPVRRQNREVSSRQRQSPPEGEGAHAEARPKAKMPSGPDPSETAFAKIFNAVSGVLIWLLSFVILGGAILYAFSSNPDKTIFGYRIYDVLTPSMTPQPDGPAGGFYAGDMIIVKKAEPSEVEIGDVITFLTRSGGDTYLSHRLIDIYENENGSFFLTKGDANNSQDPPIPQDRLVGKKVYSIPKLGVAIRFVRANIVISGIFIVAFYLFVATLSSYLRKPQAA